ncbi:MAG: UDP-3-O-acyl-N-acetylglucosamine deacetylase [Gammaproteobacteria bacterium]|nr:UDP-3-O-acyl-N-acetylglucosamine deacetylase [Gammaproteobacteria bacterium]
MLYSRPDIRTNQGTLKQPIHCVGYGLHSREKVSMSLMQAPANSGVHFLRRDIDIKRAIIPASWHNLFDLHPYTVLINEYGVSISKVEPLLAALRGCGVDNVLIEVSAGEVPVLDGSSAPLVAMIQQAGIDAQRAARQGIWIDHFVAVRCGEQYGFIRPGVVPEITVDGVIPDGEHKPQLLSLHLLDHVFEREIAPARNPEADLEHGYDFIEAGNPNTAPVEAEPRFSDEFARYRIQECLGFLALTEAPICGQLYLYKPSRFLVDALLQELYVARDTWRQISYTEIDRLTGEITQTSAQKTPDRRRAG